MLSTCPNKAAFLHRQPCMCPVLNYSLFERITDSECVDVDINTLYRQFYSKHAYVGIELETAIELPMAVSMSARDNFPLLD